MRIESMDSGVAPSDLPDTDAGRIAWDLVMVRDVSVSDKKALIELLLYTADEIIDRIRVGRTGTGEVGHRPNESECPECWGAGFNCACPRCKGTGYCYPDNNTYEDLMVCPDCSCAKCEKQLYEDQEGEKFCGNADCESFAGDQPDATDD